MEMEMMISLKLILVATFLNFDLVAAVCPAGFDQVNSKCITISTKKFTHHKAELSCKEMNAHLVFIKNAIDNNAILRYGSNITNPMWMGITCKVSKEPTQCLWDDGSAVDYRYPVTNIGTCAYLDSNNQPLKGRWISATCGLDEYHAVCEADN